MKRGIVAGRFARRGVPPPLWGGRAFWRFFPRVARCFTRGYIPSPRSGRIACADGICAYVVRPTKRAINIFWRLSGLVVEEARGAT